MAQSKTARDIGLLDRRDKVLVIQTANIGDVISSMVVIDHLRKKFSDVDVIVRPGFEKLLTSESKINTKTLGQVMKEKYELIVDLDSSSESRKILQRVKAPIRVGRFAGFLKKMKHKSLYTTQVPKYGQNNIVKDYYPVLEEIGGIPDGRPVMKAGDHPEISDWFKEIRENHKVVIGIHVEASNPIRSLPRQLVIHMIDHFNANDWATVLFGTRKDGLENLRDQTGGTPYIRYFNLDEIKTALTHLNLFVAPDSGPLHLAGALSVKSLGLYGPTLSSEYGQISKAIMILEREYDCRPCDQNKKCKFERRCLNSIHFQDITHFFNQKNFN